MDWFLYDNGLRLERVKDEEQNGPLYQFFSATFTNLGISPQNIMTFSFNPFAILL